MYPVHIKHSFSSKFGQISSKETFWASAGFESTEESVTLSDAPRLSNLSNIQVNTNHKIP